MRGRLLLLIAAAMTASACEQPRETIDTGIHVKLQLKRVDMKMVERALELFRFDVGRYPTTEEGLGALMQDPGIRGWIRPYISNPTVIQGLEYKSDGKAFRLRQKAFSG